MDTEQKISLAAPSPVPKTPFGSLQASCHPSSAEERPQHPRSGFGGWGDLGEEGREKGLLLMRSYI